MVGTTRGQKAAAAAAAAAASTARSSTSLTASMKKEVSKHCVETAILAANRVCDFRIREIDTLVENYISIIPVDVREKKLCDLCT